MRTLLELRNQPLALWTFPKAKYIKESVSNLDLANDYLINPDYEIFNEEVGCSLSTSKRDRILSRIGPGYDFHPTKLDLPSHLPVCNWTSFIGVLNDSKYDAYRVQLDPVRNIFRDEDIKFHMVVPVSHKKDYPLPKFANLDIVHKLEHRKMACNLNINSAIRWPMCCNKYWKEMHNGTVGSFPIGAIQPCAERIFIGSIPCGFVDWGSSNVNAPGTVFIPPHEASSKGKIYFLQPSNRYLNDKEVWTLKIHDRIATALEVYGKEHGHFVPEVLPFVVLLVLTLPEDVPILIQRSSFVDKFLIFLSEKGLTSMDRFIHSEKKVVHAAREVIKAQYWPCCTEDANFTPSQELAHLLRRVFAPEIPLSQRDLIVIVHREDAKMRVLQNHNEMVNRINNHYPDEKLQVYVSKKYEIAESIELFRRAKIVIGAHGAGMMINLQFCGQHTHIIEIGYDNPQYTIPSGAYALARALNLEYWLTVGQGGLLEHDLHANLDEVMKILDAILK